MRLKNYFNKLDTPYIELFSNSFWSVIGSVIAKILLFLVWIFVARILSPELYGEFSIIKSTTLLFADFVGMSFAIAATKYIAEYHNDSAKLEKLIGFFILIGVIFGIIACLLVFCLADKICIYLLKAEHLKGLIQASSLVLFVSTLNNGQMGILRGFSKYKLVAKINLLQILLAAPVFVVGTIYFSLKGAVFAYVFYNVIVCFLAQYEIRKICKERAIVPTFRNLNNEVKVIFNYILPYMISIFVTILAQWYNETRVAALGGEGFVQLGYYSAINVIQTTIISFAVVVCSPFVPIMAKYKKDASSIAMLNRLNTLIPLYVSMLIAIPLMLFPQIITIFYGDDYATCEMYILTVIIVSYSVLIIYKQAIARLVAVYELQWIYLLDSVVLSVSFVVGFKLLYSWGIFGLTCTFLVSYLLSCLIFTPVYVRKGLITKDIFKDKLLWLLVASMLVAGGLFVLNCALYVRLLFLLLFCTMLGIYIFRQISAYRNRKKAMHC